MQAQQIQHLNQQMQQLTQDLRNVVEELRNTTADFARYRNDALAERDGVRHEIRQMEVARNKYHKESHYLREENDHLIDKHENIHIKNHPATISYKGNDKEHRSKRMSGYHKVRRPPPTSQRGFPCLWGVFRSV